MERRVTLLLVVVALLLIIIIPLERAVLSTQTLAQAYRSFLDQAQHLK